MIITYIAAFGAGLAVMRLLAAMRTRARLKEEEEVERNYPTPPKELGYEKVMMCIGMASGRTLIVDGYSMVHIDSIDPRNIHQKDDFGHPAFDYLEPKIRGRMVRIKPTRLYCNNRMAQIIDEETGVDLGELLVQKGLAVKACQDY